MVRLLGHRRTKGAATDTPDLPPPRDISTLPIASVRLDGDLPETERHISGANILAAGTALPPLFAKPVSLRGLVLGQ